MVYDKFSSFCRTCFEVVGDDSPPCPACNGRRIVTHQELFALSIAHLDCDAFYASIEKRDNPALENEPVIVGGGVRGVVSTCCYIARTYGVRSAMPMFKARKLCPDAVIIKPDMKKYVAVGRAIRALMRDLTPLVEPISIDEAFLDLSGTARIHHAPPAITMARLQRRIESELGVTASVGLSHNKFLAKLASDFDKPRGFSVIGKQETISLLSHLPVTKIWGVGAAMARKLHNDGIRSIADLQKLDEATLGKRYGEIGLRLARLSQGRDSRKVKPERDTKSVSSETTFNEDISDPSRLDDILWELCEKTSARMKVSGFVGRVITLKLKTADFQSVTRRRSLSSPTNLTRVTYENASKMLHDIAKGDPYRLIGVGFSDLSSANESQETDLFGETARISAQEKAIDAIREKFGDDAVKAARSIKPRRD